MQTAINIERLKYPIGPFIMPEKADEGKRMEWIKVLSEFPDLIKKSTSDLTVDQLSWIYRPQGWNIRQVVHHCADSHLNGLTRFKWALTELNPVIKPYLEAKWSMLADNLESDIKYSLDIIDGVHKRWVFLMNAMDEKDWARTFVHPENNVQYTLAEYLALYAWHCTHHLAHITQALNYQGTFK